MIFQVERPGSRKSGDREESSRINLSSPDGASSVSINPNDGGTVESLRLPFASTSVEVLSSRSDFAGCILWPFNDRIRNGRYRFQGWEYRLPPNDEETGDAIHGFLYRKTMEIAATGASTRSATVTLTTSLDSGDEPGYPFTLSVTLTYRLTESSLSLEIATENRGDRAAPLTVGWHPYFILPGRSPVIDTLLLETNAKWYYAVEDDLIPTGKTLPVTAGPYDFSQPRAIARREIDMCFGGTEPIITTLSSPEGSLRISHEAGFERLQLYIPPLRESIAVEPVRAAADAFNNPELGLTVLQPGERDIARVTVGSQPLP